MPEVPVRYCLHCCCAMWRLQQGIWKATQSTLSAYCKSSSSPYFHHHLHRWRLQQGIWRPRQWWSSLFAIIIIVSVELHPTHPQWGFPTIYRSTMLPPSNIWSCFYLPVSLWVLSLSLYLSWKYPPVSLWCSKSCQQLRRPLQPHCWPYWSQTWFRIWTNIGHIHLLIIAHS